MPPGEVIESAFAPVPERAAYVPRPASEAALGTLVRALASGERMLALRGPVGMGKSLLLRLLETRTPPPFDVLHVAPGALPLADLLAFALGARTSRPGRERGGRALDGAAGGDEAILVLPVDDAQALTPSVARGLAGLVRNAEGALRLVLAFDDAPEPALAAALGGALREVLLDEPLSEAEVARYVDARLERAGAPEGLRRRIVNDEAARLHAQSGGNPGRLNRLAAELRAAPAADASAAPEVAGESPAGPSLTSLPRDPFGPTAAASLYQARSFSERILGSIERELLRGRQAVLLRGPGGIGKTTLLRVLEARLRDPYQIVSLPYARLAPGEFWSFVLHQLGAPPSSEPDREVLAIATRLAKLGHILVLLLDEATSLPEATGDSLAARLAEGAGALRAVLTADDEAAPSALPRFADAAELRVDEPLSAAETEAYVLGRLLHFGAPLAVRRRFDRATLAALHRDAGGLPRALNRLAGEIERQVLAPPVVQPPPAPRGRPAAAPADASAAPPLPPAAREPEEAPAAPPRDWLSTGLALLPHVGLGLGIPLALLALWLWLAPLFADAR